jgi:hypothetical protein
MNVAGPTWRQTQGRGPPRRLPPYDDSMAAVAR